MADAVFAVAQEPASSPWRDLSLRMLAQAHLLAGHLDEARALFAEESTVAATLGNADNVIDGESELVWLAMDRGEWQEAAARAGLRSRALSAGMRSPPGSPWPPG